MKGSAVMIMVRMAKVAAGLGTALLVAVMAQASTASNTISSSTAGYGSGAITGASANSVSYTLSPDGTTITAATVVFAGDQTGKTVTAGFNAAALSACSLGAFNSGADTTTATCSGLSQSSAAATTLAVAVR
jgi:hypothetical protein